MSRNTLDEALVDLECSLGVKLTAAQIQSRQRFISWIEEQARSKPLYAAAREAYLKRGPQDEWQLALVLLQYLDKRVDDLEHMVITERLRSTPQILVLPQPENKGV